MSVISSKVVNAIAVLTALGSKPKSCPKISEEIGISISYIETIFTDIAKAGLARGKKGMRGGYYLARPLTEITLVDVVNAIHRGKPRSKPQQQLQKTIAAKTLALVGSLSLHCYTTKG
jgi:Rrf2 family protein